MASHAVILELAAVPAAGMRGNGTHSRGSLSAGGTFHADEARPVGLLLVVGSLDLEYIGQAPHVHATAIQSRQPDRATNLVAHVVGAVTAVPAVGRLLDSADAVMCLQITGAVRQAAGGTWVVGRVSRKQAVPGALVGVVGCPRVVLTAGRRRVVGRRKFVAGW